MEYDKFDVLTIQDLPERELERLSNDYNGLWIKAEGGKPYWCVGGHEDLYWQRCPTDIFLSLLRIAQTDGTFTHGV
jgi:hypothetical protein